MKFEFQPTLRGELVILRPLRADDWAAVYAAGSDPLIWEQHPYSDRYKEENFREYFQGAMDSGGAFAVLDATTGETIGCTRYHNLDEATSQVEIGWTFLARSRWGGAYNGEMKRLLLRHAFRFVETVVFRVGLKNFRSQRAVQKIGGIRAGNVPHELGGEVALFRIARENFAPSGAQTTAR
jgi:RimJ/RimL family protein N-acetyltransferase